MGPGNFKAKMIRNENNSTLLMMAVSSLYQMFPCEVSREAEFLTDFSVIVVLNPVCL